jgi:hypothetical protein
MAVESRVLPCTQVILEPEGDPRAWLDARMEGAGRKIAAIPCKSPQGTKYKIPIRVGTAREYYCEGGHTPRSYCYYSYTIVSISVRRKKCRGGGNGYSESGNSYRSIADTRSMAFSDLGLMSHLKGLGWLTVPSE